MANQTLASLTTATPAAGGFFYGTQSGADRKFTLSAAGAALLEANSTANQRSSMGAAGLGANTFTGLQTITQDTVNTGALTSTGYSLTGSDATSMMSLAGTWNTTGTPTALKVSITDTASNSASLLIDCRVSGTSKFSISKQGQIYSNITSPLFGSENLVLQGFGVNIIIYDNDGATVRGYFNSGRWFTDSYTGGGTAQTCCLGSASGNGLGLGNGSPIGWASTSYFYGAIDLTLSRAAAASLQLGVNDATTPTAQTIKAHDVTTGTGADLWITGGKGSLAGGSVILGAYSGGNGFPSAGLTITPGGGALFASSVVAPSVTVSGVVFAALYATGETPGVSGTITAASTVTVTNGIITNIA